MLSNKLITSPIKKKRAIKIALSFLFIVTKFCYFNPYQYFCFYYWYELALFLLLLATINNALCMPLSDLMKINKLAGRL